LLRPCPHIHGKSNKPFGKSGGPEFVPPDGILWNATYKIYAPRSEGNRLSSRRAKRVNIFSEKD